MYGVEFFISNSKYTLYDSSRQRIDSNYIINCVLLLSQFQFHTEWGHGSMPGFFGLRVLCGGSVPDPHHRQGFPAVHAVQLQSGHRLGPGDTGPVGGVPSASHGEQEKGTYKTITFFKKSAYVVDAKHICTA